MTNQITKEELLQLTSGEMSFFSPTETHLDLFTDFSWDYIAKLKKGEILTPKKVRFSSSTITQYKVSIEHFVEFEKNFPQKFRCSEISNKLLQGFELYLTKKGLFKNSVSLYVSKIKAIGNILFSEEITFRPIKYSTAKELTTKIYLSLSELSQITNCETLTTGQRKIWDIFLIQCFTALRYETLCKFLQTPFAYIKEYEGFSYIDIVADKTGEQSLIPLSEIVTEIIHKYNGNFKIYVEQYVNRTLKIIGKKAEIDNSVSVRITEGGKVSETLTPKYKLITTHTARRTFISLAKQTDMTDREISGVSGHSSEKQLNDYNRTTNLEKVKGIFGHPFFSIKL